MWKVRKLLIENNGAVFNVYEQNTDTCDFGSNLKIRRAKMLLNTSSYLSVVVTLVEVSILDLYAGC